MTTRTLPRYRFFTLLLCCLLVSQGLSRGQSLYDVVVSLSDRQRVVNQRQQVVAHLRNQNKKPGDADLPIPGDFPIDWVEVGTSPTKTTVDGLGIGGKTALLNQAVQEFERLKYEFLNSSDGEYSTGSSVGSLRYFGESDYDPLPRATPGNHQELLAALAQRVGSLRLIVWVAAYSEAHQTRKTIVHETVGYNDPDDEDENDDREPYVLLMPEETSPSSFTWKPAPIGPDGFLDEQSTETVSTLHEIHSEIRAGGTYSETETEELPQKLRSMNVSLTLRYPESAQLAATAPGADGDQIDGAVFILRRSKWHEISVDGAHPFYETSQAGHVVVGTGNSGSVTLFEDAPAAAFDGEWLATGEEGGAEIFVPEGFQYQNEYAEYGSPNLNAYEFNWLVGCSFRAVFKPAFTRGVDAAGVRAKLESAAAVSAGLAADGKLLLTPRPGLLFGIELGAGLKGSGNGYVSCGSPRGRRNGTKDMHRFDSTYSLQFAGSSSDYHVVYDNDRSGRSQSLPGLCWNRDDFYYGNDHWTLYEAWDSPRLRQVAGRDLVADVEYDGKHYGGYTVRIYRRATGSPAPVPGQALDVSGMTLIRTWAFSHPGGETPHPTDAEKLEVAGDGDENYVIEANHILTTLEWDHWMVGWWGWIEELRPGEQGIPYWRDIPGSWSWTLKAMEGTDEKHRKEIEFASPNVGNEPAFVSGEYLDGQLVSTLSSMTHEPFSDQIPADWEIAADSDVISGSALFIDSYDPGHLAHGYGKWPSAVSIDYGGIQPDADYTWDEDSLLASSIQGSWGVTGTAEGDAHKLVGKFGGSTVGTTWTEILDGGNRVKTYSAPDGSASSKNHPSVAWSEVEYGTSTVGLPGLPHIVRSSDDTGATYGWDAASDGSHTLTFEQGTLAGNSVSKGVKVVRETNTRGHPVKTETFLINGGTVKTGETDYSDMTPWGMPEKATDALTGFVTEWTFDGGLSRLTGHTGPLGLTTEINGHDILGRPGSVSSNGITTARTYSAFSTTDAITGGATGSVAETRDALGRLTATNTIRNGVTASLDIDHGATDTTITGGHSLLGSSETKIRKEDGSLDSSVGETLAFGGVTGDALSVSNGLLVTKTAVADLPGRFVETHADAWGRTRKVVTPSKSGGSTETKIAYSDPGPSLRRVITTEPNGRILITESDTAGTLTRSGIDVDGSGSLGSSDRYTESTTTVTGGKIVTVLMVTEDSGLREVLRSEFAPATGVTETKINGNEETITSTPDYTAKTVKVESSKGWERNTALNNLGLASGNTLSGTGLPATNLTPTWRADGSLEGVSLTIGGETHTATFNPDSTLATLTAPGRGNILGGHSIGNGVETLTIDGVTVESKLDGTETDTSGGDVIGKNDKLTIDGGGFKNTVTPEVGAPTDTTLGAAGAPLAKTYADSSSESYEYEDELLTSVSLARGGEIALGYSNDGAKDLTSAVWPAMDSGVFSGSAAIPGITQAYGYSRSGNIKELGDHSGVRMLGYLNGRLFSTAYTSGLLQGYEVIRHRDATGRHTGILLKRDGASIHSTQEAPNGASDQITDLASGNITATPQRDGAGRITGYIWSDGGTNTVTQTWQRGAGGRIEFAGSDVSGAPSFDYETGANSFDQRGRRLKCQTSGGAWTYVYGAGGQLTSATHPTLGTFNYAFDGIGRRTDKGTANTSDLLNRTTAWTHNQNKTLTINAHPDARVWFNGVEIPDFTGQYQSPLTPPGPEGGWVPWETLAVLEGAGEGAGNPPANPLASPDAKAEKRGAVWVPPAQETFGFDAAGNRQSSAQWDYGWDAKNQLARARTKNHTTAPQAYDITFTYDAEGRRVRKHVLEYASGAVVSEKTVTFVWDGWDLLYERHQLPSGLTTLERKYLWGPDIADGAAGGAGGLLLIRETKGTTTTEIIPLYDGTGHVTALTNLNKDLLATYAYGPFGEKIHATGPLANSNPWRYVTKYLDEETGLYYFGKRYFDPITGQFLSREPLGESESVNLYSYCHNDPVNNVDVLGLRKKEIVSGDAGNRFRRNANGEWEVRIVTVETGFWGNKSDYVAEQWQSVSTGQNRLRLLGYADFTQGGGVTTSGSDFIQAASVATGWDENSMKEGTFLAGGVMTALVAAPMAIASGITAAPALYTAGYVKATGASVALQSSPWGMHIAGGALTAGALLLDGEDPGNALASGGMQTIAGRAMTSPINWNAMRPANWGVFNPAHYRFPVGQTNLPLFGAPLPQYVGPRPPPAYSVAMEVRLTPAQMGMNRDQHFAIGNRALRAELASNPSFSNLVPYPQKLSRAPEGWTWQHATASQARDYSTGQGRPGFLHLVPKDQHTGGSFFWRLLHPLPYGGGGYSEWAIPAGAPPNNR